MPPNHSLTSLPVSDRPREKLSSKGADSLSDTELLAILLRTGCRGTSVIELSHSLLHHFGSLDGLLSATPQQLKRFRGLGQAKIAELQAVMAICRRVLDHQVRHGDAMTSPDATRRYLQLHFKGQQSEQFACLFLDTRHRVLALETLFYGTLDSAAVYPREILKRALALNAAAVILSHNHPSGDPEPSRADIRITQAIRQALDLIDINVLDHMIIGQGQTVSLAERGLL